MITASSLSRLMNCAGSAVLPRAENASQWADMGHSEHEELAAQLADGTLPEWIAAAIPAGSRSEVALAFDVSTGEGRILGENIGRAYNSIGPFEIVGSCDTLGTDGDAVVVTDFKTGFVDVEPAATNPQLAFYALTAARALGRSLAIVRVIYTKTSRIDSAELDAFDLASFSDKLKSLHMRVAKSQASKTSGDPVPTREGSWCRYCASIPYCGAKNALLVQVATSGAALIGDSTMTPARAASAYEQIVRVESLVRDARKRLETYVDENGPISLGDGRMFGRYVRNGSERLDGAVAVQAIAEVVGESAKEFESIAVERKVTKAAIERAAKALGCKRGTVAAVVRRVRDLGGASHGADTMPIGEYTGEPSERPALDVAAVNAALEHA